MHKKQEIKELYKEIFGDKIISFEYNKNPTDLTEKSKSDNKCLKCKDKCDSYKNRQDLPYFKSFENVKTIVIAESPGKGIENGELGYVFGWEQFESNSKKVREVIRKYENYFFNVLNLDRNETYITDAIKCYTAKDNFSKTFSHCKPYLEEEIRILQPENILVISKQNSLKKFLNQLKEKYFFQLNIIHHPSNQNISKIKTVGEIFEKIGEMNSNEDWKNLGAKITEEYKKFQNDLKAK